MYDQFAYQYQNTASGYAYNSNRLSHISEPSALASIAPDDIDNQEANNYQYDDIGNQIKIADKEIERIEWTVYGKPKAFIRAKNSTKPDVYCAIRFELTPYSGK